MARNNVVALKQPEPEVKEKVYLRRAYTRRKALAGQVFYMAYTIDGLFSRFLSAADRDTAKKFVLTHYPNLVFFK